MPRRQTLSGTEAGTGDRLVDRAPHRAPVLAAAAFKAGALPAVAAASVSAGTSSTRRGPSPGW
ncbi:hypothetical protein [Streptomyces sp. NPDC056227]|uniref:hypothetical protein n=1 Tax=Streptomyces sp. NPDC056227 TaxID=3345753 RepID=UPI0035DA197D